MKHSRHAHPRGAISRAAGTLVALACVTAASTTIGLSAAATGQPEGLYAPSAVPDRIVLTPTADTTTSQSVTWRTSDEVTTAQAQIAPSSHGPGFTGSAVTVSATTAAPVQTDLGYQSHYHTATFTDLQPGTAYLYRVGDGSNWSEWSEFTTAGADDREFSFIYYGDAQNDIKEHVSRVYRNAFSNRPRAEVLVHAGDLVDREYGDAGWGEWFHAAGWINGVVNVIATTGNHEYPDDELTPQWQPQFEFPGNGPDWSELPDGFDELDPETQLDETVYYVDHKGVRFISLNSNTQDFDEVLELQAEWLDEVLEENPNHWSVVTFHHPVFSVAEGNDNPKLREHWLPVFRKHDVDLVLNGHDHTYGRGNELDDAASDAAVAPAEGSVREYDGTVYVVSIAGPKMNEVSGEVWADNNALLRRTAEYTQLYQLVDVAANEIRYEARTATGRYYDGLTIHKDDDGNKNVVDDDDPENLPPEGGDENGDDTGTDDGSDDGSEDGTDEGGDDGTDGGTESGGDDGTETGGDDGTDSGTDGGGDTGTETGGDDGTDSGGDAGTESGGDAGKETGGTEDGDEQLPDTGASLVVLMTGAVVLLGIGAATVTVMRRKAGIEL